MNRLEHCDGFGCNGVVTHKVVSWIHPLTGLPVWRKYCFVDVPVHCPECKFSIGIRFLGRFGKKRQTKKYHCENCKKVFYL